MFKAAGRGSSEGRNTKAIGDDAESLALAHLQRQGLVLVQRNYRVAGGPHARGAEVDLILRERDGTLVFVEVRSRSTASHGGALASVGPTKQRRIVRAAQHYRCGCRCCHPADSLWWRSRAGKSSGSRRPSLPGEAVRRLRWGAEPRVGFGELAHQSHVI